jgi:hypothetical protein
MRNLGTILVALGAAVLMTAFGLDVASAHDGDSGLVPLYGDGRLMVDGDGFGPDERLTVAVGTPDGGRRQFAVTASGEGHFHLVTDLPVRPGDGVRLDVSGDRGSVRTTIASVSRPMPWDGVDLTRALAVALGGAIVLVGGVLLWSRAAARPRATAA